MTKVTMTVNGMTVSAETEGRTLLSAFLREGLALTGTHVGCDTTQCAWAVDMAKTASRHVKTDARNHEFMLVTACL